MRKIIVEPNNPLDIVPEEAEELAKAIRVSYPKYRVQVRISGYRGYAVTLCEVIAIWVAATVTEELIKQVVKIAVDWARERFRQKQSARTTSITIYGPKSELLRSIVVKNATDEPEDRTKEDINMHEIATRYRKTPFWESAYQRLRRMVSKAWPRKD